jgi:hypothetical protein
VGLRAGLDTEARGKVLCPRQGSNPGRPARRQTLQVAVIIIFIGVITILSQCFAHCMHISISVLFTFIIAHVHISLCTGYDSSRGSVVRNPSE